jgi:integrase
MRLNRWCCRAKIRMVPPYAFRHYFGAKQAEAKTNLGIIAQMMGHTKVETTMRYLRNAEQSHLDAVDAIGDRLQMIMGDAATHAPSVAAAQAQYVQ